jgi:hypothetical protein
VIRILFTYVVPFLLPIVTYSVWVWWRTRYADAHGGEAPAFEKGPWPLLLFAGAVFALIVLGVTAFLDSNSPDEGDYVPPRLVNGEIVPGHIEPRKAP